MTLLEGFWRLWPPYRRRHDAALKEAIRDLVNDPSLPCMIGDTIIPDGYGSAPPWMRP